METVSTSQDEAGVKPAKRPRQRSVAYPSYTLESCINFTTKIDKEFTSVVFTPADAISKNLNVSGGAFLMQLSSCSQYKVLELKSGEGYKPSDKFQKIKNPLPSENVNDTLIECFQSPPLYKKLIAEFRDKQLPTESGLANILARNYEVYGNAATIAAKVFLKNVVKLGLLGSGNILKLDGSYIPFEEAEEQEGEQEEQQVTPPQLILASSGNSKGVIDQKKVDKKTKDIPVFLDGDEREAKVQMPMDFTEEDLRRVIKVLSAYLP